VIYLDEVWRVAGQGGALLRDELLTGGALLGIVVALLVVFFASVQVDGEGGIAGVCGQ
jgi:hypothetical protein